MVTVAGAMSFMMLALLAGIDIFALSNPRSRPANLGDWANFVFINIGPVTLMIFMMSLILPDFLAVYTEAGIKWPSLRGQKFMRWAEVTSVEDRYTFWRARKIILKSSEEKITINPQVFINEDDIVNELKKHIPEQLWSKTRP